MEITSKAERLCMCWQKHEGALAFAPQSVTEVHSTTSMACSVHSYKKPSTPKGFRETRCRQKPHHVIQFGMYASRYGSTRWRSWLRHCATSRKVAGSIPDGVITIFHCHNPSGRTMTLGLTRPLTEVSKMVKVKKSHYSPGVAQRVPGS